MLERASPRMPHNTQVRKTNAQAIIIAIGIASAGWYLMLGLEHAGAAIGAGFERGGASRWQ
jgi:hypothetical protein